jgi:hypothetical protein
MKRQSHLYYLPARTRSLRSLGRHSVARLRKPTNRLLEGREDARGLLAGRRGRDLEVIWSNLARRRALMGVLRIGLPH